MPADGVEAASTAPQDQTRDYHTVWQVKASTLCNLRCKYCYEWDGLADTRRMSLDQWGKIFSALNTYRNHCIQRFGGNPLGFVAWHGGEPTLLPRAYAEQVLDLQHQMLGETAHDGGTYLNAAVTNLFSRNATLKLMIERKFMFSVSLDGVPGARVDRSGRDSEARVLKNLEWVIGQGGTCGVSMVIGRHNFEQLAPIYNRLEGIGLSWLRLGAMITPPDQAPGAHLSISKDETLTAMTALMDHRAKRGSKLSVSPIDRVAQTASRYLTSDYRYPNRFWESRFIVRPDGTLATQAGTTSPEHVLGNVFCQEIGELLSAKPLRALEDERARLYDRHCKRCRFEGACDQRAIFDIPEYMPPGPCGLESALIEAALVRADKSDRTAASI